MLKSILIPKDRLPVLIGKNGKAKREIERMTRTKIKIGNEITISGESIDIMDAANVVRAIARGFSPEKSFALLKEGKCLVVVELPRGEKALKRIRSRIIGSSGRARRNIEKLTGTRISVYGKTVSIIGEHDDAEAARDAIERLVRGFSHRAVYQHIGRRKNCGE